MQLLSYFLQNLNVLNRILRQTNAIKILLFVDGALPQNCFIDYLLFFLIVGQFGKNTSKFFFCFLRTPREPVPIRGEGRFRPFLLCISFDRNSSPRLLHFDFSKSIHFNFYAFLLFLD
jgi:hypothetical protein